MSRGSGNLVALAQATKLDMVSHVSYSLNSLKGALYRGLHSGTIIRVITEDTRSLDYSSYGFSWEPSPVYRLT